MTSPPSNVTVFFHFHSKVLHTSSLFWPSFTVQLGSRPSCLAWIVLFAGCIQLPDPVFFFFSCSFFCTLFFGQISQWLWVILLQIDPHGVHEVLVPLFDAINLAVWSSIYSQLNMAVPPTAVGSVWWSLISDSIQKTYATFSQLNAFSRFTYGY